MPEIPTLPETTILLVEVGSTAHGTGLPGGEDHDEMGVVIEPPEAVFGLDLAASQLSCSEPSPRVLDRGRATQTAPCIRCVASFASPRVAIRPS